MYLEEKLSSVLLKEIEKVETILREYQPDILFKQAVRVQTNIEIGKRLDYNKKLPYLNL